MQGVRREYPADDELVALIAQLGGSVNAAAEHLGVPEPTLRSHVGRRGLRDRVQRERLEVRDVPDRVSREEVLEAENRELRARLSKGRKEDVHSERIVCAVEQALNAHRPRQRPSTTGGLTAGCGPRCRACRGGD